MTTITEAQLEWLYETEFAFRIPLESAAFKDLAGALAKFKKRMREVPAVFDESVVKMIPQVNSYGHTLPYLDQVVCEALYYFRRGAASKTPFDLEEASKFLEYVFDDVLTALEAAGFDSYLPDNVAERLGI